MSELTDKVKHVVVLMLENRSFDHMLGFLDHPKQFNGLTGTESNPVSPSNSSKIFVSRDGVPNISPDPDHSHKALMRQLYFKEGPYDYDSLGPANNQGFVWDYSERIDAKMKEAEKGLRGIWNWIKRYILRKERQKFNDPADIMKCFDYPNSPERKVKVLSTLAKEFAVCDHWFCSVPGETWPNRNFAHAATSDGEVNIEIRAYKNRTIYEQLADANLDWAIYHDGPGQSWAFINLWFYKGKTKFKKMEKFYEAVKDDKLPAYSFIEPRHFKLLQGFTNNQHPSNNPKSGQDFYAAEKLICDIYSALIDNQQVWEKTLFVITYDEHGGFFDHQPPPNPDSGKYSDGKVSSEGFKFDLLGPRVSTVMVSPYIEPNTVDSSVYEHSSIPATIRKIFNVQEGPLPTGTKTRQLSSITLNLLLHAKAMKSRNSIPKLSRMNCRWQEPIQKMTVKLSLMIFKKA